MGRGGGTMVTGNTKGSGKRGHSAWISLRLVASGQIEVSVTLPEDVNRICKMLKSIDTRTRGHCATQFSRRRLKI